MAQKPSKLTPMADLALQIKAMAEENRKRSYAKQKITLH